MLAAGNLKDLWMPLLCMTLLLISAIYGLVDLFTGATLRRCNLPSLPPRVQFTVAIPNTWGWRQIQQNCCTIHKAALDRVRF